MTLEIIKALEAIAAVHARQYGLDSVPSPERTDLERDRFDAFRHAYTSAVMARDLGSGLANLLGIGVEARPFFQNDPNMDLWNNSVGRNLVEPGDTDEDIARKVKEALDRGDLITDPKNDPRNYLYDGVSISLNDWIESGEWMNYVFAFDEAGIHLDFAKKATQGSIARMDPLAFDLGGFHGIDTTGKNNGVLFDHNADGVKNGTGWVREYDAWLALDKDGNGTIDNGRELFGDNTIKSNGERAQNGFDALADWDVNEDGVIDAQDEIFTELRLWRDANQDGISQSEELLTLSDLNIASINLQNKKENINLDGTGNVQTLAANLFILF